MLFMLLPRVLRSL
jgi:hypothetical protein